MTTSAFAPRFRPRRTAVLVVVSALAISLAALAMVLGSFGYRSATTERIPVAVVNLDQPATSADGSTVAAGRQLAADLVEPETPTVLSWSLTNRANAAAGLADGAYDAVVTIPNDFSSSVVSLAGDRPAVARLTLETNDATSPVAGTVSEQVVEATTAAFGTDVTVQYLETTYQAIDQSRTQLMASASSASDLADGAQQLATSTSDLASGADSLAGSADQLTGGTSSLATAATSLADGAASTAQGAGNLAAGTRDLAAGAATLSDGTTQVANGAESLADTTQQAASSLAALSTGSTALATSSAAVATGAAGLAATCPPTAGAAYCAQVAALKDAAAGAAHDAGALSAGLVAASSGAQQISVAASSLADGATDTQSGAADLATAATATSQGAANVVDGADDVASGAGQVASAAHQVDDAATGLASAAADLASGAGAVQDGAQSLATSSQALASGLSEAAGAIPDYSDQTKRTALASAVATPAALTTSVANPVGSSRPAVAAVAVVLALWLAATTVGLRRPALPQWALAAGAGPLRATLLGLTPYATVAAIAALAFSALAPLAGIDLASPAGFAILVLAAGLTLGAIQQAVLALAPRRGQMVGLLVALLQLVCLTVPFPVQTAPDPVQWLAPLLPMPVLAQSLHQTVVGGSVVPAGVTALTVVVCTAAALLATKAASRRTALRPTRRATLAPHGV
jgi:putative membrane protein